jgi:hypothetical protein
MSDMSYKSDPSETSNLQFEIQLEPHCPLFIVNSPPSSFPLRPWTFPLHFPKFALAPGLAIVTIVPSQATGLSGGT